MGQPAEEPRVEEPKLGNFRCYFCGSNPILFFQGSFVFCPECAALYFCQEQKATCDHINSSTPLLVRHPWINKDTNKPFVYAVRDKYLCSECDAEVQLNA